MLDPQRETQNVGLPLQRLGSVGELCCACVRALPRVTNVELARLYREGVIEVSIAKKNENRSSKPTAAEQASVVVNVPDPRYPENVVVCPEVDRIPVMDCGGNVVSVIAAHAVGCATSVLPLTVPVR